MNISYYKHIIWDWNGTLFDDLELCVTIMNEILKDHQLPEMRISYYQQIFGFPVQAYYQKLGFDFATTPFEKLSDRFIAEYERRKHTCQVRPETLKLLEAIRAKGIGQSVLSAYKQSYLDALLKELNVHHYFEKVNGLDNHHAHGKTDVGKKWIAETHLNPNDILFIGDTLHDAEVASAMGVNCVLVVSGHQDKKRLESCGVPVLGGLNEVLI